MNWEKKFREIFKPIVGTPKGYQGSTMLYVPYEEVVHFLKHSQQQLLESLEEEFKKKKKLEVSGEDQMLFTRHEREEYNEDVIGFNNGINASLALIQEIKGKL